MLPLMYMYFIQMLLVIMHSVSLLLTNAMKMLYKKCVYSHRFTPLVFTSTGGNYGSGVGLGNIEIQYYNYCQQRDCDYLILH